MIAVDGNNVMGARPDGWWRDRAAAARRLVELVGAWAQRSDEDVVVVFDGGPMEIAAPARVEVRFADRRGRDAADDVIVAIVSAAGRPVRVVTSDAGLAARVRAFGADVMGAGVFRKELGDG